MGSLKAFFARPGVRKILKGLLAVGVAAGAAYVTDQTNPEIGKAIQEAIGSAVSTSSPATPPGP